MAEQSSQRPVLWHLPVSHYSEKVRWALDYKRVEHDRHAPVSGYHMAVALLLTRGRHYTFPVLELDGRRIADSTAIIAALEQRFPDPPLYPVQSEGRRRALALEDSGSTTCSPATARRARPASPVASLDVRPGARPGSSR